jgi:hypothetical protein
VLFFFLLSLQIGQLTTLHFDLSQVGGAENRRDTVIEFAQKAISQSVPVTLEIYEHEVRCFHMIEGSSNRVCYPSNNPYENHILFNTISFCVGSRNGQNQ